MRSFKWSGLVMVRRAFMKLINLSGKSHFLISFTVFFIAGCATYQLNNSKLLFVLFAPGIPTSVFQRCLKVNGVENINAEFSFDFKVAEEVEVAEVGDFVALDKNVPQNIISLCSKEAKTKTALAFKEIWKETKQNSTIPPKLIPYDSKGHISNKVVFAISASDGRLKGNGILDLGKTDKHDTYEMRAEINGKEHVNSGKIPLTITGVIDQPN